MDEQEVLVQEAEDILERLQLMNLLQRYGETRVVGSVSLKLLVKLDLDIHVLLNDNNLMASVNSVTNQLLDNPHIREVRISDYRPEGVKIGIDECPAPSGNWTIDIWLTTDISTTAFNHAERILSQLTPEKRKAILAIKQHYYRQGKLRDGISSVIYDAVLQGVSDVGEFEASTLYKKYRESK